MLVVVSPTLRRLLIELAVGRTSYPLERPRASCIFPPPPSTTADRASDLLAATSALATCDVGGGVGRPERRA